MDNKRKIPAIPPKDYEGSVSEWKSELIKRGFWSENSKYWFGETLITIEEYKDLLKYCERKKGKN